MTRRDDPERPCFAELSVRVYRLCLALLGNDADASDAAQESLTRAWQRRRRKRPGVSWWTWTAGFSVRVCRETRRRHGVAPAPFSVTDVAGPEDDGACAERADRLQTLHRSILRLPGRQREVVTLRLILGRSIEETAAVLGCPAGTVKSNLHKAVRSLHGRTGETETTDELRIV